MTKLNVHPIVVQTIDEEDVSMRWPHLERSNRLIVLIPPNFDFTEITRRIWELAHVTSSSVQLLGLCNDGSQEPSLRRELVTISALIQDIRVTVEIKVEDGTNWLDAVKRNYRVGDMIVCAAEQTTGIQRRPLHQILESNLKAPIYVLSSLDLRNLPQANRGGQIVAWVGSLTIIVAAFLLQIQIVSFSTDWVETTLFILSVLAEIALIGVCNGLFG
jgi:hypothetical protein